MNEWRELVPRKIRRVENGKSGRQYLISLPESVVEHYAEDVMFTVKTDGGQIVLTPVTRMETTDAA